MLLAILLGLLSAQTEASPARMERMVVSEMRSSDLESSASGYAYDQRQGLPVSYVRYTNHGSGRYYHTPGTVSYVLGAPVARHGATYEPAVLAYTGQEREIAPYVEHPGAGIANYGVERLHEYAPSYVQEEPRAPYYDTLEATWRLPGATVQEESEERREGDDAEDEDGKILERSWRGLTKDMVEKKVEEGHESDGHEEKDGDRSWRLPGDTIDEEIQEGDEDDDFEDNDEDDEEETGDFDVEDRHFSHVGDIQREFDGKLYHVIGDPEVPSDSFVEEGNGGKYSKEEESSHGEKGEDGYKSRREFDEGEREELDAGEEQGFYDDENGRKKDHTDTAGGYGRSEEAEEDEKGGSYGRAGYHKKGRKTNGFHNVYRKDEYKKDTDFYDEDHNEGHFDKYAREGERHEMAEGGFEKGRRQDSGFDRRKGGKEGQYEKGQRESHEEGHGRNEAEDSYRHNSENYAVEEGANSIQKQRYDGQYAD